MNYPSIEDRAMDRGAEVLDSLAAAAPFRPLGYDHEHYYFLPARTQQIATLAAPSLKTDANLMRLAPLEYWEAHYPTKKGVAWQEAMADLMEHCHAAGPYDPRRVRGRGAWDDGGQAVLHLGDRLLVDNAPVPFHAYPGRFIYERRRPLETRMAARPATAAEATRYGELLERLHWVRPTDSLFAGGFAFLAPICGALKWRPHVFLTGPRGCGKSYVLESMIAPVLGPEAFLVEGTTTEAGIRQDMQADALPVIFDEIEVQAKRGDDRRIQGIFELARLASSDSSARVVKGSGSGDAISFRCRSMFLFGAVNVSIKAAADASRISILHLRKPPPGEEGTKHFRDLENAVADLMTDDYLGSLRARAYHMIPVIRQSSRVFADALAAELGEQRLGDQVGTLLAGAFAMLRDGPVTEGQAADVISMLDLSSARESQEVSDEQACLEEILAHQVRVETDRTTVTRSLGSLLLTASRSESDDAVQSGEAEAVLARHGVRIAIRGQPGCFAVANRHRAIRGALGDTVWRDDWAEILSRLPGSRRHSGVRFGPIRGRAILLPVTLVSSPEALE